jgi:trigger factor
MNITVEDLSKIKKKINFEISANRVDAEIDKVYEKIRKNATIKGFRKGNVPHSYIEKYYAGQMASDVLNNMINETYFKAISEQNLFPVAHPIIESEDVRRGEPLLYSATIEIFPEIVVGNYSGLNVKKEKYEFSEDIIISRLNEMRDSVAHMVPVEDRAAILGDFVTIDFVGSIDSIPFENGSADDFVLELGSGRFIPGFEEQLVGLENGAQKEVHVVFPENYGSAELAGKNADFAVTIKEIKCKSLPPLDDDFAREFGEFETLEELKSKLAEYHEKREKDRIGTDLRERLVKELVEKNVFEIPQVLVERQLEGMLENTKKRLSQQRASLEMMGLNEEQYRARFRDVAETQVKGALLLEGLAKQENIVVAEEDLDDRYRQISEQSGQNLDNVKKYYQMNEQARGNIISQVREDKVIEFLLKCAVITEVSRDEL